VAGHDVDDVMVPIQSPLVNCVCCAGPPVHRERIRVSVPEFNVLPSQGTRAKLETFLLFIYLLD
jgi:hypothetical protein